MRTVGKMSAFVGVVGVLCLVWPLDAQATHPIDTRPEGQKPDCSYSGGVNFGDKKASTTSSNDCASATNAPVSAYTQPDFATTMAQQAAADKAATDQAAREQNAKDAATKQAAPQQTAPASGNTFAFPGETEVQKLNDDGTLAPPAAPAAANTGTQAGSSSSSSDASGFRDAGSEGTSSSSSSSSSSSAGDAAGVPDAPDVPGDAAPAPKRTRRKLPQVPRQSPDEREAEDIQVGKFYMNDSDYRGAYERGKDAVSIQSDDWEAHLLLADAARKLGKFDEAQAEYKKVLALDPVPKGRKAAVDSLKQMGGNVSADSIMP